MFSKILVSVFLCSSAFASYESAEQIYGKGSISLSGYRRTVIELVKGGYYFSAIPWMKDFMVKNNGSFDSQLDDAFDLMLYHTGVKPFESLPDEILRRSRSGNIRFILAKRLLRKGKYQEALQELSQVSSDHQGYPYVANLRGTIHSIMGNHGEAETQFKDCIRSSERMRDRADNQTQKAQLLANHDYCIAGLARGQFAAKEYKKSDLNYLDISKDSYIWPEILFEEAWNSYYLHNYNRTLGKLVSYKAPVFDFIFKPEVEVLKALTYMKMCMYDDVKRTADGFYGDYLEPSRQLRQFLISRGKDYKYFYTLMADHEDKKPSPLAIADSILKSIRKEPAFLEMKGAFTHAMAEYNQLRKNRSGEFRENLIKNIKMVSEEYRTTLGAYVRAGMVSKYAELYSAFQGMSYIKLEVLAQRKEKLYKSDVLQKTKRGDIKYIERNDKQYFWTFNGEFWADELGDYVFALGSEC